MRKVKAPIPPPTPTLYSAHPPTHPTPPTSTRGHMTTALAALQSVLPKSVALANELGFMMKFHRNYKSEKLTVASANEHLTECETSLNELFEHATKMKTVLKPEQALENSLQWKPSGKK